MMDDGLRSWLCGRDKYPPATSRNVQWDRSACLVLTWYNYRVRDACYGATTDNGRCKHQTTVSQSHSDTLLAHKKPQATGLG